MTIPITLIAEQSRMTTAKVVSLLGDRGLKLRRAQDGVSEAAAFELARDLAELHEDTPDWLAAAVEMEAVHRNIRRHDFNLDLLRIVRSNGSRWGALPSLEQKLKACYVEVEVLDYFGHYPEAAERLGTAGNEQLQQLRGFTQTSWPADEAEHTVVKRRIWVALAYATVLYRQGDYDHASEILDVCDSVVAASGAPPLLGTRARLAHARGQVYRQTQRHAEASLQFELSTETARLRLKTKTPEIEQTTMSVRSFDEMVTANFEDHRLLAHATVGKCLALGIGWIEFSHGRLASASLLMNAGYALLRSTGDVVHRAYAMLLIGAVRRARAGSDATGLGEAITIMEDGAQVLSQHPMFCLHASYELLLAYYKHPRYHRNAAACLETLRDALGPPGRWRSRREAGWASQMSVVESRFRRLLSPPELVKARKAAETAVDAAIQANSPALKAEAQIALGEVCLAETNNARKAVNLFGRALENVGDNPKVLAAAHLHMASALCKIGEIHAAHASRRDAALHIPRVEHGFIQELTARVDGELRQAGAFFADLPLLVRTATKNQKPLDTQRLFDEIEWQIILHAKAQRVEPHTLLGIGERHYRRRLKALSKKFGAQTDL